MLLLKTLPGSCGFRSALRKDASSFGPAQVQTRVQGAWPTPYRWHIWRLHGAPFHRGSGTTPRLSPRGSFSFSSTSRTRKCERILKRRGKGLATEKRGRNNLWTTPPHDGHGDAAPVRPGDVHRRSGQRAPRPPRSQRAQRAQTYSDPDLGRLQPNSEEKAGQRAAFHAAPRQQKPRTQLRAKEYLVRNGVLR